MSRSLAAVGLVAGIATAGWWFLRQGSDGIVPVSPAGETTASSPSASESALREPVAAEAAADEVLLEQLVEPEPAAVEPAPAPVEDLASMDRYQLEALKLRLENELEAATASEFQRRFDSGQAEFLGPGEGVDVGSFWDQTQLMQLQASKDAIWRVVLTPVEFPEANALFQRKRAVQAALDRR